MQTKHVYLPFSPREWQRPLMDDNARRIVAVVHRRAGKSTAFVWRGLRKALTWARPHLSEQQRNLKTDPPRVVHVLPSRVMWQRTGLWDKLVRACEGIPGAEVFKSELRIVLPNGGVYQAGGMDQPDAWRGGYADEVIEDEADDVIASGLDMVVVPMISDYLGTRVKVGTPKGNGRLAKAYNEAATDPLASRYLLRWQDTGVLNEEQIGDLRRDLDEEEFAQEMECSFTSPNAGSYYGKWLDDALREERITRVVYDPALPVYTAWDLGMHDSTAIWFFQISQRGEYRWLEYYEDSGQGLDSYAKLVLERPYTYRKHLLPHDVEVRELTNQGRSRRSYLQGLGVHPIGVVPASNPADRVAAARGIIAKSWFDVEGCEVGLNMLRAYRRSWNEHLGVWRSEPLHDAASHCADAFGTGCQGAIDPQRERRAKLPPVVPVKILPTQNSWMRR